MGDRYTLTLTCAWCDATNTDVYYAESCNFTDFSCVSCDRLNDIEMGFNAVKHVDSEKLLRELFGPKVEHDGGEA